MRKLSDILPQVVKNQNISSEATASQILNTAEEYLTTIFGAENIGKGKKIAATKLQHGFLFCDVASAAWNNRLFLEKQDLVLLLQEQFPQIKLKDIRGRVAP